MSSQIQHKQNSKHSQNSHQIHSNINQNKSNKIQNISFSLSDKTYMQLKTVCKKEKTIPTQEKELLKFISNLNWSREIKTTSLCDDLIYFLCSVIVKNIKDPHQGINKINEMNGINEIEEESSYGSAQSYDSCVIPNVSSTNDSSADNEMHPSVAEINPSQSIFIGDVSNISDFNDVNDSQDQNTPFNSHNELLKSLKKKILSFKVHQDNAKLIFNNSSLLKNKSKKSDKTHKANKNKSKFQSESLKKANQPVNPVSPLKYSSLNNNKNISLRCKYLYTKKQWNINKSKDF